MSDHKRAIWGVRGISDDLARSVAAKAKEEGLSLGQWVTRALENELKITERNPSFEERLKSLEAAVAQIEKEKTR